MENEVRLKPSEASKFLGGISPSTLAKWRLRGIGPRFFKNGPKLILYSRADLEAWLESRGAHSTSEYTTTPGPGRPAREG